LSKILLIEPFGDFIRLDRCMQSIDSWGGVYRFPLNLARIGAYLMMEGHQVQFIDMQADFSTDIKQLLINYQPDLCILSCGFPSMKVDNETAKLVKQILPSTHVSTFGVVPTLLESDFFENDTWGFNIEFDSVVTGGEPALGYKNVIDNLLNKENRIYNSEIIESKIIDTKKSRKLFNSDLYRSPFTSQKATYIEGTYGCPYDCSFCVVPVLYGRKFSKRSIEDIIEEFIYVIENENVQQITLWDEGTTFQKKFILELCDGLIDLKKSSNPKFKNFNWTTRSTTSLLDENVVEKMSLSGMSGITLGIESFDDVILKSIGKGISIDTNSNAIKLLNKFGIISIGHIILGHINDTKESIEHTIEHTIKSELNFAQFYCAVPYPNTEMYFQAKKNNLIVEKDLTKYELSNPIMNTLGGVSVEEIGDYRKLATHGFWTNKRWDNLNSLIGENKLISKEKQKVFTHWNQ